MIMPEIDLEAHKNPTAAAYETATNTAYSSNANFSTERVAWMTSNRGASTIAADGFGGPNIQTTNPGPYPALGIQVFSMNNLLYCLKIFCSLAYVGLRCSPLCFPTTFPCCGTNLDRRNTLAPFARWC
jgi:hypothetical protein